MSWVSKILGAKGNILLVLMLHCEVYMNEKALRKIIQEKMYIKYYVANKSNVKTKHITKVIPDFF